jgi:hypothetical protein
MAVKNGKNARFGGYGRQNFPDITAKNLKMNIFTAITVKNRKRR